MATATTVSVAAQYPFHVPAVKAGSGCLMSWMNR
jgi:hypothetical protein